MAATATRSAASRQVEPDEITLAREAARVGRLAEAFALLRPLTNGPRAPRAQKAMADILAEAGQDEDALKAYRRAIELDPTFAEAHNNLANLLWRKSRDVAAFDHYARAIDLKPDAATTTNFALVKAEAGSPDEAIAMLAGIPPAERTGAAWRGLALILLRAGRVDESAEAVQQALRVDGDHVESLATAATVHRARGEVEQALVLARRAIAANPGHPSGYLEAAACLSATGAQSEAIEEARQAVEVAPNDARAYAALGGELIGAGKLDEAKLFLDHAVKLDPNFLMAFFHLGVLFEAERLHDKAAEAFNQLLARYPNHTPTRINLAAVLVTLGRAGEAEAILRQILAREPDNGLALSTLSLALQDLSRPEDALEAARRGAALEPTSGQTHVNLGVALQVIGDLPGAQAAFRKALELDSGLVPALFSIAATNPEAGTDLVDRAKSLLGRADLSDDQRCQLYFSLASLHDARGEHEQAFQAAQKGKRIEAKAARYDRDQHEEFARSVCRVFTRSFFEKRAAFGSSSTKPIFIVGLPRTGTTLVEQILASHSEIAGGGELARVPVLAHSILQFAHTQAHFPKSVLDLDEPGTLRMATAYLRSLRERAGGAAKVTDKLPSNFLYLGLIALMFPKAAIICCERDPLDTFVSGYFVHFRRAIPHTQSQADFAHFHGIFRSVMDHWQTALPGRVLTMNYEALIADQARETRRLLDYCGVGWEDQCMRFHETVRPVRTASSAKVRRPLFGDSVGRAAPYLDYLDELIRTLAPAAPGVENEVPAT